jgi:integrase
MGRSVGRMTGFDHVTCFRDRHGKVRYRYRRKGCKTVYLPGKPGSPEFAAAYAVASSGAKIEVGEGRTRPGSINALAVVAYASAEWRQLSPATQTTYRGIIERVRAEFGNFTVRSLDTETICRMRDKLADRPTAANNRIKVLRWMLALAMSRKWIRSDPSAGMKPIKVKSDGFHTWSEPEIAAFEARWPVGTRERLAFDLLLHTAQRSADVRQMGRQHVKGGRLEFRQQKTGAALSLPIVPALAASLATVPRDQMQFIQTQAGDPFTAKGFQNWFTGACRAAGLAECSAHGLRKAAATRLANAGHSEAVIQSWTGHQTSKEVQRYTRARDQRRLADMAAAG